MNNENVYEIVLNNDLDNILSKKFANNLSEKLEYCDSLSKFKLHVLQPSVDDLKLIV